MIHLAKTMSETKVELQQRKIRNGIRKENARQQKKIWDKLTAPAPPPPFGDIKMKVTRQTITSKTRKLKAGWKCYDMEADTWLNQK